MPLAAGHTLTHYEILGPLGAGGMGEVYLAKDTRLEREVAIKVLPDELAADLDRLKRFEREAKTLASLNHANVAGIHGIDQVDDTCFLAMELVPGEDLAERVARGPLPIDEAIDVCRQIAEGLEAAHEAGVVHRDLKPANVRITPEGKVKLLDFGLAKPIYPGASEDGVSTSQKDSFLVTEEGLVLGTPTYMSPEQARGRAVDRRTDIWAFGCVLYECLTGKRVFHGDTFGDVIASVVSGEPDWSALPPLPRRVTELLERTLIKDPQTRLRDIGEARVALESAQREPEVEPGTANVAGAAEPPTKSPVALVALVAAALVVGAAAAWVLDPRAGEETAQSDIRFEVMLPPGQDFGSNYNRVVTISPDGRTLAFVLSEGIWMRSLDRTEPWQVSGSEDGRSPAFSFDSRQLAFWDNGHVKRVPIDGGVPVVVAPLQQRPMGIHWASDDFIYVGRADLGIWRAPYSGGEFELALELGEGEHAHGPELLPGGAGGPWIMFSLSGGVRAWTDGSIVAQSLTTGKRRELVQRGREARYLANGYLSFVQDDTLFVAPFDLDELEVTGGAEAMETGVHTSIEDETGAAGYDVSDAGVLAFAPPSGAGVRLAFADRDLGEQPFPLGPRRLSSARLSPDETRVAAQINDIDGTHIWIISVDREGAQRLTTVGRNTSPVWSHDGHFVYFASVRDGKNDVWRRPADLSAPAERVLEAPGAEFPDTVSADGRWLYYSRMSPGNSDIARVSLIGEPEVEILIEGAADELDARVSPDGDFVCFQSNETGRWDIHVMEISSHRRWIVSSGSGFFPIWTRDGNRIVYSAPSSVHEVEVSTSPDFSAGEPVQVFDWDGANVFQTMDATHDGQRFLISRNEPVDEASEMRPRATLDLNWFDEIERRMAGRARR